MPRRIEIVNPLNQPEWDNLLKTYKNSNFFHTTAWAKILHESYGYEPAYISIMDGPDLLALIPLMNLRSILTGRRGVSLPFTDCCDPFIKDGVKLEEVIENLLDYGKRTKWRYLELRTAYPLPASIKASAIFYGHHLNISGSENEIIAGFRDSTRRNIKKAEKEGVVVTIDGSVDSLQEFYRLNCMTRRDHGLPCQPYGFFKNVYSHIIAKDFGMVALAAKDGRIVAGALFLHFGDIVIYKYGASDRKYLHLRGNNLIFWKAIQYYRELGYKRLDFGRTEAENSGLLQFKRGWGATEYSINYCKYDFRQKDFVMEQSKVRGWYNHIFRQMPIPLLKFTGSMLYRHVG